MPDYMHHIIAYSRYGKLSEENTKCFLIINIIFHIILCFRLAQSVKLIFAVAIFITYALQCYVPVEIVWNQYLKKHMEDSKSKLLVEYILRTVIVIITCKY